eukprot:m.484710 g.484710  ORF g.484710 m.484710 type:complete len:138 (-) comp70079_c0_seq1:24-437(-)
MKKFLACIVSVVTVSSMNVASAHPHNHVNVIRPPVPSYPVVAAFFGANARCEVNFDLLDYGRTKQIQSVSCSNLLFCSESAKSVREAEFEVIDAPATKRPGRRSDITYPIAFNLEDQQIGPDAELQLCPPAEPGFVG